MPIFGEYETVGEAHAVTYFHNHFSTVWRVRKGEDHGDRSHYALKCITPRRRETYHKGDSDDQKLEADSGLAFIEVFKQIKKAQSEGGRSLAPIHAFGTCEAGVWYVTDFCERHSLKVWVNRQGQVDDQSLRHVVHSVVIGCLTLKRSCARSHGNLKLSNVLRGGRNQTLRKTRFMLADPMPLPSASISRLNKTDRRNIGGMVHDVFEVQDLKAIGELILQLVEGRVIESGFDYNYPISFSPAWGRLGKEGENWRDLCNQLLDPQLTLDKVNLKWLAAKTKPSSTGRNLATFSSVLLASVLVGGGAYLFLKKSKTTTTTSLVKPQPSEVQTTSAVPTNPNPSPNNADLEYNAAMTAGNAALNSGKYDEAISDANTALGIIPNDSAATTLLKQAQLASAFANAKRLKLDDPGQALDNLKVVLQMKPGDQEALALQKQINDLLVLDDQLRDLMNLFDVSGNGPAVDPKKSIPPNLKSELISQGKSLSDYAFDLVKDKTCENLKNKYQLIGVGWLNPEREQDIKDLVRMINRY